MVKTHPGTERIEEDIRATRRDIDDKVNRIRDRLSPGDMVDSVVEFARHNGGAVAGGVGRALREHPLPIAMIGAGAVWLALASRNNAAEGVDEEEPEAETTAQKLRERAASARENARASAEEVREKAGRVGHRARVQAERATRSGGEFAREHPLVVGAAGIALGAAIAATLPRTNREDGAFGTSAERVKEAAKTAAAKEGHQVRDAARSAVDRAREVAAERAAGSGNSEDRGVRQAGVR